MTTLTSTGVFAAFLVTALSGAITACSSGSSTTGSPNGACSPGARRSDSCGGCFCSSDGTWACSGAACEPIPTPTGPQTLANLDAPCPASSPAGITGRPVLDRVPPSVFGSLVYVGSDAGSATVTIERAYKDGKILCYPATSPGSGDGPSRDAYVTVDIELTFTSSDGAFSEKLSATIEGSSSGWTTLTATLAAGGIAGTFDPDLAGYADGRLVFDASFGADVASGSVSKAGRSTSSGASILSPVARWTQTTR